MTSSCAWRSIGLRSELVGLKKNWGEIECQEANRYAKGEAEVGAVEASENRVRGTRFETKDRQARPPYHLSTIFVL